MEFYYLENIQKYHADSELIGSLSNILIKNHQISNKKMSEIFNIYNSIKRLRLDQKISEPSNNSPELTTD